jgi:hypothetical protein
MREIGVFQDIPFAPDPSQPVDRWLQLPMGWNTRFIDWVLEKCAAAQIALVIDPFCGAGATLLSSISAGRPALGIDCDAIAVVSSYAKTHFSNADDLDLGLTLLGSLLLQEADVWDQDDLRVVLSSSSSRLSLPTRTIVATLLAGSSNRGGHSLRHLEASIQWVRDDCKSFDVERFAPADVLYTHSEDMALWSHIASRESAPWLIVGSPPHPNSRGGLTDVHGLLAQWCESLASEITCEAGYDIQDSSYIQVRGPGYPVCSIPLLLQNIAASAPTGTIVVLEYEATITSKGWSNEIVEWASTAGFRSAQRLLLYIDAPDGRPGVIEGGVLVLR